MGAALHASLHPVARASQVISRGLGQRGCVTAQVRACLEVGDRLLFPVMLVARLLFTTMLGPLDRVALRDALRYLFVNASLIVARTAFVNRRLKKKRRNVKSCSSVTCAFWELTSRRAALLCMLSYSLIIVFRQLVLLMQSSTASSQQRNTNHTHKGWRSGDLIHPR